MHTFDTTMQLAAMRQDELLQDAARRRSARFAGRRLGRRTTRDRTNRPDSSNRTDGT